MDDGRVRVWTVLGVAAVVAAGGAGVIFMAGDDDPREVRNADRAAAVVQAAMAPAAAEAVTVLDADPEDVGSRTWLDLDLPATAEPSTQITAAVAWTTATGTPITGQVDVQQVTGAEWSTVADVAVDNGSGTVDLDIDGTSIYRVVYGGSDDVGAAMSDEVTVQAGDLLPSTLAVATTPVDEGYEVTASWATEDAIAIRGTLEVQQKIDDRWSPVGEIATGDTGTGTVMIPADDPDGATTMRLSYPGGPRFAAITSESALTVGDDIRTIPVTPCSTDHEIDVLARGAGCHFTPVSVGTFVVAHDYLGNAWWNEVPMGTVVELDGELAGVYEVIDRVMAPGRGAALGSAANWACGEECDVILQTCKGSNTGFTWLSRIG